MYESLQCLCNTTDGIVKTINHGGLTMIVKMRRQLLRVAEKSDETYKLESFVIDGKFLLCEDGNLHKITHPKPEITPTTRFVMTIKEFLESRGEKSYQSERYM